MIQINEIQKMLSEIPFSSGEADRQAMYSVADEIRKLEHPRAFVPELFQWLETNSQFDLGSPGPFVHFIEEKLDYFDLLVASINRKPTDITVWMVNRIANSKTDANDLASWVDLLNLAARHPLADEDTVDSALDFAKHQTER
jgi:hypothetical protein